MFCSIQGEGTDAGVPTTFIRLFGCNIGCKFCDQPQLPSQRRQISIKNLVNKVAKEKLKYVCITGGEPLLQDDIYPLIYELVNNGYKVSIETSGCIPIDYDPYNRSFKYIMDVKCPCSGVTEKNVYENLIYLKPQDEVKFIIATIEDYNFFKDVLRKYPISAKILLSPMFNNKGNAVIGRQLSNWVIADRLVNVRLQIQLHKVLNVR